MEQLGLPADDDAPPGRGDPRPARHRRPARRDLRTLSGGQQQRVAIGSVLTMHPRLLVLDEPTSALDPTAAEDVLATLTRLVHDLGVSVLLAEHRLERVVPFADRMCLLAGDGRVRVGEPGRAAGALARRAPDRRARPGRRLGPAAADASATRAGCAGSLDRSRRQPPVDDRRRRAGGAHRAAASPSPTAAPSRSASVDLALRPRPGHRADGPQRLGQVLAAVGAAGQRAAPRRRRSASAARPGRPRGRRRAGRWSGWCRRPPPTCSTSRPSPRSARPPTAAPARAARSSTGWCPASPATSTRATCPRASGWRSRWRSCWPAEPQRAAARRADPRARLRRQARAGRDPARGSPTTGRAVLVATHDVEFVAQVADEVVVLAEGEVVSVGPGTPGGRRVAGVRAAGDQGARPAVAAGRRGRAAGWRRCVTSATRAVRDHPALRRGPRRRLGRRADDALLAAAAAGRRRPTRVDPPFLFLRAAARW